MLLNYGPYIVKIFVNKYGHLGIGGIMAQMPIEIARISANYDYETHEAIRLANAVQGHFSFTELSPEKNISFAPLSFRQAKVSDVMNQIEKARDALRGYHPHLVIITDTNLYGDRFGNLFGSTRANRGVALVTTSDVEEYIIPKGKMISYFLYYLARSTLKFIAPNHKNHDDTRECLFDMMLNKLDIKLSMKENAVCDECRQKLLEYEGGISGAQLKAVDRMLALSGYLLTNDSFPADLVQHPNQRDANAANHDFVKKPDEFERAKKFMDSLASRDTRRVGILILVLMILLLTGLVWLNNIIGWDKWSHGRISQQLESQ